MLIQVDAWQRSTSRRLRDRDNPLVTDIDILLGQYHTPGKTDLQKLKLVILIRRYCSDWLTEKGEKGKSFRRPHVTALFDQTTQVLQTPAMTQAMAQRMSGGSQAMPGKQMIENMAEVLQPRASAKAKFGLQADMQMTRVSAGNLEQRIADFNMQHHQNPVNEHDVVQALDFIGGVNQQKAVLRSLTYLQKRERLACRLQLWPDQCLHRGGSQYPHESPGENELYAIDSMEFIYTANQPAKAGSFHHSSFLSGKPVLCAGEIRLTGGRIVHIDNLSGHYQPTTQHLLNAVNVLQQKYGVNLERVSLTDMAQPAAVWRNAAQFQRRQGVPLPAAPQGGAWVRGV